ncbi:MAG TPA: response regulator [Opitutus sp.]|nr:response regulator [Opitutus sp.]
MATKIRLLLAEDDPGDAELVIRAIRRAGYDPQWARVETEADFVEQLHPELDLVVSDYAMPEFGALRALALVQERGLQLPFLIVSGTIGEETAVEAMKLGATDYLLKDRLARLGQAIAQALEQKRLRREHGSSELARRDSEERFRQIAENIREVFWLSEPDKSGILYVSPAYESIWGRSCESLIRSPRAWLDAIHDDDRARVREALPRQARGSYDEEYRIQRPDGTVRWIRDRAFPVRDAAGHVFRIAGVAEDVTERKQLEAKFLRVQRLQAIGTLAGGVAHDLNNILSPMLMAAGVLKDAVKGEEERDMLRMIEQSARRGADIIRQLLTFSRGVEGARSPVQLRHLLLELEKLMLETFPRKIAVHIAARQVWTVVADSTQLHQVILNLCVNARDAMPEGGNLSIAADNVEIGEAETKAWPEAKAGPYVLISVKDTGTGIAPENIGRIFDPFFTTKPVGKGTGLGLSTVMGIVQSHGGFVSVDSDPGAGTTFKVFLPAVPDTLPESGIEKAPGIPTGHGEMVLVVDDEAAILSVTSRMLERHNYGVLTAADGRKAIEMFVAHREQVKLVLTDLMMPEVDGMALIRALRVLNPDLPIIATSGWEPDSRKADWEALGMMQVLPKPCTQTKLLEAVDRALTGRENPIELK